jgi:hypothetical protein
LHASIARSLRAQSLPGPLETNRNSSLDSGPVVLPGKTLAIALLAATFCQCASGPALSREVELKAGSRTLITLQQASLELTLINQSALTESQAVAARKADRNLKLIPDDQVQFLLDRLGGEQFFGMANEVADPEARSWLTVMIDGKKHILSGRAARGDHLYMQRFSKCINLFSTIYSANDSFAGSKMTLTDLKRAGQSTNSESAATRRKKGNSKRP